MGVVPGVPGAPQAAAAPKTLLDEAKLAFSQGDNQKGFQYLYAHYLCGDNGAADVQSHMKWSQALRRPTVAMQFGIGVVYLAPRDYTGNPMAIGNDEKNKPTQTASSGRRRRGRGNGGGGPGFPMGPGAGPMGPGGVGPPGGFPMGAGGGGPPGGFPMGAGSFPGAPGAAGGPAGGASVRSALDYYTGELGEKLLEKLEEKIAEGAFGDVQQVMGQRAAAPAAGFAGAPGAFPPASGIADAGGVPGGEPMDDAAAADGSIGGGAAPQTSSPEGLRPGITYLGADERDALEKKAREQDVDVLILYEVNVRRPGKTGVVGNSTKIRVTLVERPDDPPIYTTPALVNVEVASAREKDKEPDPVDDAIDKLMAKLESFTSPTGQELTLKLGPMPENLTPQPVANRVTNLTSSKSDNPLRDLVEIKFFHSKKLINDQQFQEACKAILADKAEMLAKAKEAERREALTALLPKK